MVCAEHKKDIKMEAKATAKFVRYTPRKVNQVLALIRNKRVEKAFIILSFLPKSAVVLVQKVLRSATANVGRLEDFSGLKVKEAWVGNGPILKRMRPGPKGRGMPVKKRTAHLTIVVTDVDVAPERRKKKSVNVKATTEIK
ncbi:50S ribosomal protein L22 [Endomicrobiia bacterium]|nr:50S ribosomal protein L22 [Endomicrobiia bacterium]GHT44913.1 50S ribosomal protein L22 [Endomicrobiia bacterium]